MLIQMPLLRNIFWFAVFLISTLSFVVLFEKGPDNFVPNLKVQIEEFSKMVMDAVNPPKSDKDKAS